MTISLPDPMREWIDARIREGQYASASDYLRDLVRKDRQRLAQPELTIDDLRRIVADARAGGDSERSAAEIFEVARLRARSG